MPAGRPTDYSDEMVAAIVERISNGESLRSICSADEMPNKATVFKWLALHKEFNDQYARAREIQADLLFDEMVDISDSQEGDVFVKEDGTTLVNHDVIARAKLRIDTRKWVAGKLRPKVYGDKVVNEHTGLGGAPIRLEHSGTLAELTAEEREQIRSMMAKRANLEPVSGDSEEE